LLSEANRKTAFRPVEKSFGSCTKMPKIRTKQSKLQITSHPKISDVIFSASEIVLKVLAHNNFIGRIIGKGGNIINLIKKDTETKCVASHFSLLIQVDVPAFRLL
jgi:predicted RNA-binding protein YlqC (UPF0109 family)